MKLKKACSNDFDRITIFYKYVIDNTDTMAVYGRWIYGLHPTDEMIRSYIDSGTMYYVMNGENISACAALTFKQGDDYHPVEWSVNISDDEVAVVHILCVDPKRQKQGLAKEFMRRLIDIAKDNNMKAVRLDALCSNIPAHRLYESLGFEKRGTQNWYASNTGNIDFYLFEYLP